MVLKNHPLSGEDRKIVSTRLYQSEFLYLKQLCEKEGKTVNKKLREMIKREINNYPNKDIFTKKKEDQEKGEEELKQKYTLEIKGEMKNV